MTTHLNASTLAYVLRNITPDSNDSSILAYTTHGNSPYSVRRSIIKQVRDAMSGHVATRAVERCPSCHLTMSPQCGC